MLCPSCRTRNRENARFCKHCGQTMAVEIVVTGPIQPAVTTAPAEEPTQYLQPRPQSTQQNQPAQYGQAQGTAPTELTQQNQPAQYGQAQGTAPTELTQQNQSAARVIAPTESVDENDPSMAPTQILTPAQRIEYLSRHWQQEILREQAQAGIPNESSGSADSQEQLQQELADAPTVYAQGWPASAGSAQGTIPTVSEGTIPTVSEGTIPTVSEGMIPTVSEGTIPTVSEGTIPTVSEGMIPTVSEGMIPTVSEGTIPTVSEGMIPTGSEGMIPTASEGMIPTVSKGMIPTGSKGTIPTVSEGMIPTGSDVTDIPTISVAAKDASARSVKGATEVSQVLSDEQKDETLSKTEKPEGEEPEQAASFEEEKTMTNNPKPAKAEDTATATGPTDQQTDQTFPALSVGTKINDRYEVIQLVKDEPNEHVYQVLDRKGYLHCWVCNSTDNTEGADFCEYCGVQLLKDYLMHEYPATPSGTTSQEASVLQAKIVDTIMENGHTYAIELQQTEENAFPTGAHLLAACDSDAGELRRSDPNEDSTLVLFLQRVHESLTSPAGIFLVADGLGGHSNGQYASRLGVNVIAHRIVRDLLLAPLSTEREGEAAKEWDEESLLEILQDAIEDANTTICQVNQRDKTDMGCTLTGFMIAGERAYIFNVGDSRTYILRDDKIYQLTKDHSLVGQLVEGGLIEPDDVYNHPQRSQIYRSIGDKLNVQIDFFKQQIHPGDILLSCSDGLWEMVRDPQIAEILNAAPDPQTAAMQLIEAANANGGEDNVSAVVVFVR